MATKKSMAKQIEVRALEKHLKELGVARVKDSRLLAQESRMLAHVAEEYGKTQKKNETLMAEQQSLRDQLADFAHVEEEYAKIQEKNEKLMAANQSLRDQLADLNGVARKAPTQPELPPPQHMLRQTQPPQFTSTATPKEHKIVSTSKEVQWDQPPAFSPRSRSNMQQQERAAGACSSSSSNIIHISGE